MCDAVEINTGWSGICGKILTVSGFSVATHGMAAGAVLQPGYHESAVQPGQDIRHILRAFSLLRPGGVRLPSV